MHIKPKLKLLLILLAAALLIAGAITAVVLLNKPSQADSGLATGDTTACTDGNWVLTKEWSIERADSGEETLRVAAAEDSTAWNTFFTLYQDWRVSTDMSLTKEHGLSDCLRLVFGDGNGNVCAVVSAEYQGKQSVLLKADVLTGGKWKNVLRSEERMSIEDAPLNLSVARKNGKYKLDITLTQNGNVISEASTKTIKEELMNVISRPGLSVYNSEASFSGFAVAAKKPTTEVTKDDGLFEAEENVPTDEWLLGEGAVHNLLNGESAIIVDGEKEKYAWNLKNTLGDTWTLSFKVEFGKSYRDSVCARFMFGPSAELEGEYLGLITANYVNNSVMLQAENKESGAWITTASSMGWKPISGRSIRVAISKYPGINRLAVFFYDGDRLLLSTFTDEMTEQQMAKYVHYGVMVYSSQVRFSQMTFEESADEAIMPDMSEKVYPTISKLTIGEAEKTSDWKLSKHTVYFHENGKESMVIDSKGEEFSYYTRHSINGSWSASAKVDFGTYYSDTAGVRLCFTNTKADLAALLTVKYSPADSSVSVQLQSYDKPNDIWTDVIKSGWAKGESSFTLQVSGDAKGSFTVKITGASGAELYEKTLTLDANTLKGMQVIGLGTISAQSKYSDISMELTGGAVTMSGSTEDSSDKTMYALSVGTPASTEIWTTGSGITCNTQGALIIKSGSDLYSYNKVTDIQDAFTISTDVLFGSLDGNGVCTARVALVDQSHGMQGLFTVKFSKNFEVMVEGQYNLNGVWYSCVSDNSWRAVQDNRVHITLSRAAGSNTCTLAIRDFGGNSVFYASCTLPKSTNRKIVAFGLGVDKSTVKFSGISATVSGTRPEPTLEDYGLITFADGTAASTDEWTIENGITYNTEGALIVNTTGNLYSHNTKTKIYDGFSISTDVQFGSLDKNGVCSARIALMDKTKNPVGLFTVKFSDNFETMVEGQYNGGSSWTSCVSDTSWRKVQDNRLHITLTRADGSPDCVLTISDYSGKTVYSATCAFPENVAKRISGFALGADASRVRFSGMTASATAGEEKPPQELIPITETGDKLSESAEWSLGEGIACYSDGSLIITGKEDVYSYRLGSELQDTFTISAKLHFGALDSGGISTARLSLVDAEQQLIGLYTFKFSSDFELLVEGQYLDSRWHSILADSDWHSVTDNIVSVTLSRKAGESSCQLIVTDSSGAEVYHANTSVMPEEINTAIKGFGLGCRETTVKFSEIVSDGKPVEPPVDEAEPIEEGTPGSPEGWTTGSGISTGEDGSIIIESTGESYTYYNTALPSTAFTAKTDIIFGSPDSDSTCTARFVLAGAEQEPLVLITVKYSDKKEIMVTAQYRSGETWTTINKDAAWRTAGHNHVVLTVSKAADAAGLSITVAAADGTTLYTETTDELPQELLQQLTCMGLGASDSKNKFSGVSLTEN